MDLQPIEQQSIMDSQSLILEMLNNDCLFHILSFLNLQELIVAEKVSERFAMVTQQVYNSYRTLNFSDHLFSNRLTIQRQIPIAEATEIASKVGSNIHTLKAAANMFRMIDHQIPEFVHKHLKNLKNIDLRMFKIMDDESIGKFAEAFKGVTTAKLDCCNTTDKDLAALFKVQQLEVLELPNSPDISGAFLAGLTNIQELNVECCPNIDPQLFIQFCKDHPKLRCLNIIDCTWINKFCLQSIAENLQNLEKLMISHDYHVASMDDYYILADLPKLKHLKISCVGEDPNSTNMDMLLLKISFHNRLEFLDIKKQLNAVTEQALRNLTNLKELNLSQTSNCKDSTLESLSCEKTLQCLEIPGSDVTSNGLKMLIERCAALMVLNVMGCRYIDGSFVSQILGHIRERSHILELMVLEHPHNFPRKKYEKTFAGRNPTKLKLKFQSFMNLMKY